MRKVTFQEITKEGLNALGKTIMLMAEEEALLGHSKAVKIRLKRTKNKE
jgi:histidinol dehydrogenase